MKGRTYYSERVAGARGNYQWSARYDLTDGYLGISQKEGGRRPEARGGIAALRVSQQRGSHG